MNASNAKHSSNVVPLPYAVSCHSALLNILYEALRRALARQLVSHDDAQELLTLCASRDSGRVRLACEVILAKLEASLATG